MIRFLSPLLILIYLNTWAQHPKEVILTIDKNPVYKEEFIRLYQKNNQGLMSEAEKKSPKEYLELFINYKLKVRQAEELGMDTLPGFLSEFNKYREELAKPYLSNADFTEEQIQTAYERATHEVSASHILIRVDKQASPEDTLAAYKMIMDIRTQALAGTDFNELASQQSQDPSAIQNKGMLGYFSAFQMVYPFEDAAFRTPVGEISMPVRTQFGYHLIKVHDLRENSGQMKVAHIMKQVPREAGEEAINRGKAILDSLANLIRNGADFAEMAQKHSDDRQSAINNGELPWFTQSTMQPDFATAAFALKADGDLSPVIRTPFGWHLMKRLGHKPVPPLDEMRESLISQIRRNNYLHKQNQEALTKRLKADWNYQPAPEQFNEFARQADQTIANGHIQPEKIETPEEPLFSYQGEIVRFKDFARFLRSAPFGQSTTFKSQLHQLYEQYVAKTLLDAENNQLEEKHPEFGHLVQEYHDGILLFNLSEKKIWSVAANDSAGLEAFYLKNKGKHLWDERFQGWIIRCETQNERDFVDQILAADSQLTPEELQDRFKHEFNRELNLKKGTFEKGDDPLADYLVWNSPQPADFNGNLHFIHGNKIAPQTKTLQEARGLYMADYQDYLEEKWIKELRKEYRVRVNKGLLKTIECVK